MYLRSVVTASLVAVWAGAAFAHEESHAAHHGAKNATGEEMPFGRAGDPKKVDRTLSVGMYDSMHFSVHAGAKPPVVSDAATGDKRSLPPGDIVVQRGDTVRFIVRNDGKVMHEMVIGTMALLQEHAAMMKKFPAMEHDEAHMTHVAPGKTGEIVWQFTRPGEFHYACLLPGHMEAGMIAKITVQ